MRILNLFLTFLIIVSFSVFAQEEQSQNIAPASEAATQNTSLDEAIIATLKNSPDIEIANEKITQAKASLTKTRSSLLPSANASGTFTRFNKGSEITMPDFEALILDPTSTATVVKTLQPAQIWSGNVTVTIPLVVASLYPAIGASKIGIEVTKLYDELTKQTLVYNCTNLYLNIIGAHKKVKINEVAYENTKEHLSAADIRLKSGIGAKIDLTRAEILTSQANLNLIQAQEDYNLAKETISILMGKAFSTPAEVKAVATEEPNFNDNYNKALAQRKDYQAGKEELRAAEKAYSAATLSFIPTLSAQGAFNVQDQENFNGDVYSWQAMVILNWDIFSGFSTNADVKSTRSVVNEKKKNLKSIELKIQQDTQTAINHLKQALSKVEISKKQLELAEVNKDAEMFAYKKGASSNLDYNDAYLAWVSSQTQLTATEIQLLLAQNELKWATGTIEVPKY